MRIDAYKIHLAKDKHIINQAIYDGDQATVFAKEREEWDNQRAKLLFDNKSLREEVSNITEVNFKHIAKIKELDERLYVFEGSNQDEYQSMYNKSQYKNKELEKTIDRLTQEIIELQRELKRDDREKGQEVMKKYKEKEEELKQEWLFKEKEWKNERRILKIQIKRFDEEMQCIKNSNDQLQEQLEALSCERLAALENKIIELKN